MRIVITGLGMISAVGTTADECWTAIQAGRSGVGEVTVVDTTGLITSKGGQSPVADEPGVDRCFTLAVKAATEAVEHGRLAEAGYDPERVAVVIGSSLGTSRSVEKFHEQWIKQGLRKADVRLLKGYSLHSVADLVAERLQLTGPRATLSNACAAGAVAIGYASELLWSGEADVVLVGGVDPLAGLSFNGFHSLGALDSDACSPYTRSAGLNLGEGAGFLLLENADAAARRGVPAIAEVAGYGLSADAYHLTAPDPGGDGASRAMTAALRSAGHTVDQVDYINGHGTGTPTNDKIEPKAIRTLFKTPPPVSSTKSMIGHTLGAAGAVEAVVCAMAVRDGILPPTANTGGTPAPSGLDIVPEKARHEAIDVVVSNSFAFGGNNAALVIRNAAMTDTPPPAAVAAAVGRDVVITGVAGIAGSAHSHAELLETLASGEPAYREQVEVEGYGSRPAGTIDYKAIAAGVNPAVLRRMDPTSRLAAAAVEQLHRTYGKPSRQQAEQTGLIFATGLAPITPVKDFNEGIVLAGGPSGANPKFFPNTVVNAAAGHVAILHRFKGITATVCAGGTSALSALHYAYRLISRGASERIVVVVADECPDALLAGHVKIPGFLSDKGVHPFGGGGTVLAAGAVAIVLESAASARENETPVLAKVAGFGLTGDDSGISGLHSHGTAWARSMSEALRTAELTPQDIGLVASAAMGRPAVDDVEIAALRASGLAERPLTATKSLFGETSGSAPGLALVAAVQSIQDGFLPGTWGVDVAPDELPGLVPQGGRSGDVDHALVSSFAYGGSYLSLVVSRWQS
ncbi:3-oxoacyl-[acyl-carrier-protein] synthase II [Kitasatospora gansuensis]|uniref:3-oxoacyl-[acyl-carrier-protein] synthase II n=1 Tax=Kitasatospora gansuensis TaxID=258050 RepID=A0A7W7SE69_9ACTN|nr:beta-ketoacyl-[acyl-carrier-protein] synthase family protein [Kitasatospora gansuensis]MBB4948278.1 3-oxoacyl-[acyl-carrier-protein] synthase II [Kitasatospora gansuensis]